MIKITSMLGKVTKVTELDQVHETPLNAIKEAQKWSKGIRKFMPKGVYLEEVPPEMEEPWG